MRQSSLLVALLALLPFGCAGGETEGETFFTADDEFGDGDGDTDSGSESATSDATDTDTTATSDTADTTDAETTDTTATSDSADTTDTDTTDTTDTTQTTDTDAECMIDSDCDDANACTTDSCDGGTCMNADISASCDDQIACTADSCDMVMGCINDAQSVDPGMQTFMATGQVQQFQVPDCVTSIHVVAYGAQGGSTDGGKGAMMSGDFDVTPAELLGVVAGSQGVTNTCGGAPASGGGGGGSFVWHVDDAVEPMIAAGGGGGGNVNWGGLMCRHGLDGVTAINGTAGNGVQSAPGGMNGNGGSGTAPSGVGAGGAGWKGNGQNSTWGTPSFGGQAPPSFAGGAGSAGFGPGGEGGFGGGGGAVCGCGGGGGYSGGGAGEGSTCRAGGGGGGSYNTGINTSNMAGVRSGNGEVQISWGG